MPSTSLPHLVVGEVVSALYSSTACTHTSECFLDSNGLQCAKLFILVGHLLGGDLFHLYFEAWDRGLPIFVGPQFPTTICNWAPRLSLSAHSPRLQFVTRLLDSPKNGGERGCLG